MLALHAIKLILLYRSDKILVLILTSNLAENIEIIELCDIVKNVKTQLGTAGSGLIEVEEDSTKTDCLTLSLYSFENENLQKDQ